MKPEHAILALVIVGLAITGCKADDKSTANDPNESTEIRITRAGVYDSSVIKFASISQQEDGRQILSHPYDTSCAGALAYWIEQIDGKLR